METERNATHQICIDGRLHDADRPVLTISDSGYRHGHGVFTTLRLYRGAAPDLPAHHGRLQFHAAAVELSAPPLPALRESIAQLVVANELGDVDARLRITVTRRASDLASHTGTEPMTWVLTTGPLPPQLPHWQTAGVAVVCLDASFARGPMAHLKTVAFLPQMLALRRAARSGCDEALVFDAAGTLLEAAVSNVFLIRKGRLLTPPDDGRILAGLTRRHVLALAADSQLPVAETQLSRSDLLAADEVFLTNSIREIVPVVTVDNRAVAGGEPGAETRRLQKAYRRRLDLPAT